MNIQHILDQIATQDPEFNDRISSRRHILSTVGRSAALAAVPLALGGLLSKAYGQGSNNDLIVSTLNFALRLEYLEVEYYTAGLASPTLGFSSTERAALQLILTNEQGHVDFIKNTIISLGGAIEPKPAFDFTGGNGNFNGPFVGWNTNVNTFLELAQSFEQTGQRAYKGQAANLESNKTVLEAALRIHSVEARHEARLRMLRRARGAGPVKPWVTLDHSDIPNPGANGPYAGEGVTVQDGFQLSGLILPGAITLTANSASEAFDEPLSAAQVETITAGFIL